MKPKHYTTLTMKLQFILKVGNLTDVTEYLIEGNRTYMFKVNPMYQDESTFVDVTMSAPLNQFINEVYSWVKHVKV